MTPEMERVLERLYREGRRHAKRELERMGHELPRAYVAEPVRPHAGRLRALLGALTIRVRREAIDTDLTAASEAVLVKALLKIPGARDAASRLVSDPFTSGLASTFEQADDLVPGWQYSAILDGSQCEACEEADGLEFETWDQIQAFLPEGGPNPDCWGSSRCRCRPVPVPQ